MPKPVNSIFFHLETVRWVVYLLFFMDFISSFSEMAMCCQVVPGPHDLLVNSAVGYNPKQNSESEKE